MSFIAWTSLEEHNLDGSICTYDHEARAGCLNINPAPDCFEPVRTVEIHAGLLVDVDRFGIVRCVETIGHPVGMADLLAVIRWINES